MTDQSNVPKIGTLQTGLPQHDAMALTRGGDQAEITLGDQIYRLRITKAGKLILTK